MKDWFTSDTHFYHRNVIQYCKRPYSSVEEMHAALIANWNELVKPEDRIWVLGDFSFSNVQKTKAILDQLNGYKILVPGNHDKARNQMLNAGFNEVTGVQHEYDLLGEKVTLCHYPFAPKPGDKLPEDGIRYLERRPEDKGQILLHGHVHEHWLMRGGREFNVGVDVHNMKPISAEQIYEMIKGQK